MTKKRPNTEAITNELQGASLFFTSSGTPPPPDEPKAESPGSSIQPQNNPPPLGTIYQESEAHYDRSTGARTGAPPVRPKKRKIQRHTFDVFEDQVIALQTLQLTTAMQGRKKPRIGDMVRKGIDLYLAFEAKRRKRRG
jgi:hypothetical protein